MKISTKGRYALRLMLDLALASPGEPVPLRDVAQRQEISDKYLEQIVTQLSRAGLVRSVRGAGGGYLLTREPEEYTVGEILRVLEGNLAPVSCVDQDDTNPTINKLVEADMILFATPVYWWGMTAQLKQVIDKCYCRGLQLKEKKIGLIVVGGSPLDNIQYELICKQFDCMASYLSWNMLFQKCYYANARDELAKDVDAIQKLENLGKNV